MAINCVNRCMWCGIQTPHDWCHNCSEKFMRGETPTGIWNHFSEEEYCPYTDGECEVVQMLEKWLTTR